MYDFPALIQFELKPYKDSYVLGCNATFMVTVKQPNTWTLRQKQALKPFKMSGMSHPMTQGHILLATSNLSTLTRKTTSITQKP